MSNLFKSREGLLENISSMITTKDERDTASLCVALDAGWGLGKTFFLDKLESRLTNNKEIVVRYNAWEKDLSNDAFVSFCDVLITTLGKYLEKKEVWAEKANALLFAFLQASAITAVSKIPGLNAIVDFLKETTQNYEKISNKMNYFGNSLEKTKLDQVKDKVHETIDFFFDNCETNYKDKKIIVLVDELDRCRPDYSIQVLECIKHLFPNPNISFLFAINRTQLEKSVHHLFGEIDTSIYFEKFFDYSFSLPNPDIEEFLNMEIHFSGNESQKLYYELLQQMIIDADDLVSLRQIEHIFKSFNAVCRILQDFEKETTVAYMIPVAIFSKEVDLQFFKDVFYYKEIGKYCSSQGNDNDFVRFVYNNYRFHRSVTNVYTDEKKDVLDSILKANVNTNLIGNNSKCCYRSGQKMMNISNKGEFASASLSAEELGKIYLLVGSLSI